jgi:hypothetical protein
VSVELPETVIQAEQTGAVLPGKTVKSVSTAGTEELQKIGFMHRNLGIYKSLVGRTVARYVFRGMTIVVEFDWYLNLIIGLEYGGETLHHASDALKEMRFHLGADSQMAVRSR